MRNACVRVCALMLYALVACGPSEQSSVNPLERSMVRPVQSTPLSLVSRWDKTDIREFWGAKLEHLVVEQLIEARHPNTVVSRALKERYAAIHKRYGSASFNLSLHEPLYLTPQQLRESMGVDLVDGRPQMAIVVPALMYTYEVMRAEGIDNLEERFANGVVVGFLHELDHWRLGHIDPGSPRDEERRIQVEIEAWHATCTSLDQIVRGTLPFLLHYSDQGYLDLWRAADNGTNEVAWYQGIAQQYRATLQRKVREQQGR